MKWGPEIKPSPARDDMTYSYKTALLMRDRVSTQGLRSKEHYNQENMLKGYE
jgi:hypothetical protein